MTTPILRPTATVEVAGDTVAASEGTATLDAMNVPYAFANVTLPLTAEVDPENIDPRDGVRAVITAGDAVAATSRVFDLGVRSRLIDHKAKTIELELASDEALLQDYAPLADIDMWDYRASLRSLVNQVLTTCVPGAALEASPSLDADVTPRWEQTNLIPNARANVDTTGWASDLSGGITGTVSRATSSIVREGASFGSYVRLSITAGGSGLATLRYGTTAANSPRVSPGRLYTFSAWVYQDSPGVKTARALISFRNDAYSPLMGYSATVSIPASTWTKVTVTALAPANSAYAALTAGVTNGMATTQQVGVTATVLAEGARNDIWFDGARADDSTYTYDWTPDANTTPSVRVPVGGDIDPDTMRWPAGVTAWEFLEPLIAWAGLRLFCDEQRKWRLIDWAEYSVPGVVALSSTGSVEGTDLITRENPEIWCTGVIIRYRWTDSQGIERTRTDTAGTPGRVMVTEVERPFPGVGVAAATLSRKTGTGRQQEVTALAKWGAIPAQQANISLPGSPEQIGQIEAVTWDLTNGLMQVKTRALTDLIPGSIDALVGTIDSLTGTIDDL